MQPTLALLFSVGVSLFGLFTTQVLALYPLATMDNFPWRKPLIGSAFALICISGIIAAFTPSKCSRAFDLTGKDQQTDVDTKTATAPVTLKGHHPDCREFSSHIIQVRGHVLCAACTGLVSGALITFFGVILYFFGEWELALTGFPFVLVGEVGVVLGLVQLKSKRFVRSMLNAFFVLGAYSVLIGIDTLAGNALVDFYVIGIILVWVWTRILLSQWDHNRICCDCKLECKIGKKRD
jgi:hypothetical protein